MISLVLLAESTTAVPAFPRLSSRLSPFLTAAMLRYMPYVKGPHHRPRTTTTASATRAATGSAWIARMPVPSGRKARHITPNTIQQVREIFCTVTTGRLPDRSGWILRRWDVQRLGLPGQMALTLVESLWEIPRVRRLSGQAANRAATYIAPYGP